MLFHTILSHHIVYKILLYHRIHHSCLIVWLYVSFILYCDVFYSMYYMFCIVVNIYIYIMLLYDIMFHDIIWRYRFEYYISNINIPSYILYTCIDLYIYTYFHSSTPGIQPDFNCNPPRRLSKQCSQAQHQVLLLSTFRGREAWAQNGLTIYGEYIDREFIYINLLIFPQMGLTITIELY